MSLFYLIDYENVREMGIAGLPATESTDHIYVFYTDNANKLNMDAMLNHEAELKFIKVAAGKQSLDMHLVSVLGFLLRDRGQEHEYVVVSRDGGFDNVIGFWNSKGFQVSRNNINLTPVPEETTPEKQEKPKKNQRVRKQSAGRKNNTRKNNRAEQAAQEERTVLPEQVMEAAKPETMISEERRNAKPVEKEESETEEPVTEETTTEEPKEKEPETEEPETEEPETEESETEEPETEESETEEPETEESETEEPETEESETEEPQTEESEVEETETEESETEKTEAKESVAEEKEEPEKEDALPESVKEVDPHTMMNNKLMSLLKGKVDVNTLGAIASVVIRNMDEKNYKQVIYRAMVKKFGQKQGLENYNLIKKEI